MAFAGTVVGMLTFGFLADKVGRKSGMLAAVIILLSLPLVRRSRVGSPTF